MSSQEGFRKIAVVAAVFLAVVVPLALLSRTQSDDARARDDAAIAATTAEPTAAAAPSATSPPSSAATDPADTAPLATPVAGDDPSTGQDIGDETGSRPDAQGPEAGSGGSSNDVGGTNVDNTDDARSRALEGIDVSGVAGSTCTLVATVDNVPYPVATFSVPRNTQAPGCATVEPGGWEAPRPAVRLSFSPRSALATMLETAITEPGPDLIVSDTAYAPSGSAPGWRIAYEHTDGTIPDRGGFLRQLFTVPAGDDTIGGVLVIESGDPAWSDAQRRQAHALFDDVFATTRLAGATVDVPEPGGLCSGTEWAAPVPRGWFAYNDCTHFNTSSEAPWVMQCECLGPFRVFERTRTEPLSNTQLRADGLRYSVSEQSRTDDAVGTRDYRTIEIELPTTTLVVEATRQVDHAFPGHTWEDTVLAQDRFVADLVVADVAQRTTFELVARWPAVDMRETATVTRTPLGADRWIVSTEAPPDPEGRSSSQAEFGVRGVVSQAVSGRLTIDGLLWSQADQRNRCEVDSRDDEFRRTPNGAAWTFDLEPCGSELDIVLDGLAPPIARDACPGDGPVVEASPGGASRGVDVDGDRIDEHVFVDPWSDESSDALAVIVRFDDGLERRAVIDLAEWAIDRDAANSYRTWVLGPAGPGAELFIVEGSKADRPAYTLALDLGDCEPRVEVLTNGPWQQWCFVRSTAERGPIIRAWTLDVDDDGEFIATADDVLAWNGAALTRAVRGTNDELPCGPEWNLAD